MSVFLGQQLVEQQILTQNQLEVALKIQQDKGTDHPLGEILLSLGWVSEQQLNPLLAQQVGVEVLSGQKMQPEPKALALLSAEWAHQYQVLPLRFEDGMLELAMRQPDDWVLLDLLGRYVPVGVMLKPVLATQADIATALIQAYPLVSNVSTHLSLLHKVASSSQSDVGDGVIEFVNALLFEAFQQRASDIHFEPRDRYTQVRLRVDGVLRKDVCLHKTVWEQVLVRLKVLAELDLTEQRTPQDGRIQLERPGQKVAARMATLPSLYGDKVVLRLLKPAKSGDTEEPSLQTIDPTSFALLHRLLSANQGLLLVTGPTGSGKTTTLYAMLQQIQQEGVNIMTLEDPIESPLEGICQTAINDAQGMSFATGVRALLRQDPDVILIGEIRDEATAQMALRAAMTGHLVLATVHANSTLGVLNRLVDLGISTSLLASQLLGVVAQRLMRRICPACSLEPSHVDKLQLIQQPCHLCHGSGYYGRQAVLEVLCWSTPLQEAWLSGQRESALWSIALTEGLVPLAEKGRYWVDQGVSDEAEWQRLFHENDRGTFHA